MRNTDTTAILQRLIAVSRHCIDAFAVAAAVTRMPRLASLFVRRAEHQGRIAAYLTELLRPSPSSHLPEMAPSDQRAARVLRAHSLVPLRREPQMLLTRSLRVLDTSILELGRAFRPAMRLADRVALDRHHDQMRWAREELLALQRSCKRWQPVTDGYDECPLPQALEDEVWFGADAESLADVRWLTPKVPS